MLDDSHIEQHYRDVLEQFRGFLRSLMTHAGVGTALGGVMTMVGEPQTLLLPKPRAGTSVNSSYACCRQRSGGNAACSLPAAGEIPPVWLRRTAAAHGAQSATGFRRS
ncbi:hypothetical protein ACLK2E_06575 [Escherichia coli]